MSKCACCKQFERAYLWQPCGPEAHHLFFAFPGWQYRGFTSVPVCESCAERIKAGESVTFTHKRTRFEFNLVAGKAEFTAITGRE